MATNKNEIAGLISRNQGGGQAPLGDTGMDTDSETGIRTKTGNTGLLKKAKVDPQSPQLLGCSKKTGVDASEWSSWKQIQALENEDWENLQLMKKEMYKMLRVTKQQRTVSMVIKDGLAFMIELYDSLSANIKKKSSLREVLKTEVAQATRCSPRKENKGPTRKRVREEAPEDSSSGRESESEFTDSTSFSAATMRGYRKKGRTPLNPSHATKAKGKVYINDINENDRNLRTDDATKKVEQTKRHEEKAPQKIKEHKAKKKKKKGNKRRPEALLIKVSDRMSYSDALKNLREKIKPEETGTVIRSIRKTAKGDVLLELEGSVEVSKEFQEAVGKAIGDSQAVTSFAPRASVEIRDLDILTEEEEVRDALVTRLQDKGGDIKIFLTKPNSRSQRMAIVEMAEKGVDLLMESGKIRIGCVNCRIRKRVQVIRCFRCLGYGHRARECKGTDRSQLCFRCGSTDHKGAICTETAKCVLCTELGVENTHIPGRRGCSAFGQALERARMKEIR